jgi:hypothetical protein
MILGQCMLGLSRMIAVLMLREREVGGAEQPGRRET